MARPETEPLTTAQAKARLRIAARHFGVTRWLRHHPLEAVLAGLIGGLVAGGSPIARRALAQRVARFISDG